MKALIVDDEALAREELRRLLAEFPEVEIVGEAAHLEEAQELIAELRPELLFLDVEMPCGSGFDLLAGLTGPVPAVIFTTAFTAHAVEAFRVNALDYLLKPIDPQLLAQAIARYQGVATEAASVSEHYETDSRVFVRDGGKCWFVRIGSVWLFESEGNYTRLCFDGGRPMVYRPLKVFEERLDPKVFFRANRGQIINLTHITKTEFTEVGDLVVTMSGGARVEMSRRMAQIFRETMGV